MFFSIVIWSYCHIADFHCIPLPTQFSSLIRSDWLVSWDRYPKIEYDGRWFGARMSPPCPKACTRNTCLEVQNISISRTLKTAQSPKPGMTIDLSHKGTLGPNPKHTALIKWSLICLVLTPNVLRLNAQLEGTSPFKLFWRTPIAKLLEQPGVTNEVHTMYMISTFIFYLNLYTYK